MANKENNYYFDNFRDCMAIACEAANMLKTIISSFDRSKMKESIDVMHEIEHRGDAKKHEMNEKLIKAFITPIERDDIFNLSHAIDDLTDNIEDIVIRLYITDVKSIRPDMTTFADLLIECCNATYEMLGEFVNFKKSKTLKDMIININHIEERGDQMFIEHMHELYANESDPVLVMVWSEIYTILENCCDACEDVANIVEGITIGNL